VLSFDFTDILEAAGKDEGRQIRRISLFNGRSQK
jgi:hypothetical protein